jgi:hypothetical protein
VRRVFGRLLVQEIQLVCLVLEIWGQMLEIGIMITEFIVTVLNTRHSQFVIYEHGILMHRNQLTASLLDPSLIQGRRIVY